MAIRLLNAIVQIACLAHMSVRGVREAVPEVDDVVAVEARFTAVTTVLVDRCG